MEILSALGGLRNCRCDHVSLSPEFMSAAQSKARVCMIVIQMKNVLVVGCRIKFPYLDGVRLF